MKPRKNNQTRTNHEIKDESKKKKKWGGGVEQSRTNAVNEIKRQTRGPIL